MLRLLWIDPDLFRTVERLSPEMFSSPFLGRVFALFADRRRAGCGISTAVLAQQLTQEEMNRLTALLQEPESLENAGRAMEDYIEIIETERIKREAARENDPLLLAQERYRERKDMEELGMLKKKARYYGCSGRKKDELTAPPKAPRPPKGSANRTSS